MSKCALRIPNYHFRAVLTKIEKLLIRFLTRQAIYVQRNIESCSRLIFFSGKAISITYSENVSVILGIQHAKLMCHCHLCLAWLYKIFSHCLIKGKIFEKSILDKK